MKKISSNKKEITKLHRENEDHTAEYEENKKHLTDLLSIKVVVTR